MPSLARSGRRRSFKLIRSYPRRISSDKSPASSRLLVATGRRAAVHRRAVRTDARATGAKVRGPVRRPQERGQRHGSFARTCNRSPASNSVPQGLRGRRRPEDRRDPVVLELPVVRPERVRRAWPTSTSTVKGLLKPSDEPLLPRCTRDRSSRVRRSRSSPGRPACRPARSTPTSRCIPSNVIYTPPQRPAPSATSVESRAAARCSTSCGCRATRAFAQMGADLGPHRMINGAEPLASTTRPPIDLPAPAKSRFPRNFTKDLPSSRSLDRAERRAGVAAADGAGRRRSGQQGQDHGAPRDDRDPRWQPQPWTRRAERVEARRSVPRTPTPCARP